MNISCFKPNSSNTVFKQPFHHRRNCLSVAVLRIEDVIFAAVVRISLPDTLIEAGSSRHRVCAPVPRLAVSNGHYDPLGIIFSSADPS